MMWKLCLLFALVAGARFFDMKIVCGMAAKSEDWVIGLTARAALLWCDELIVLNHNSEDATQQTLEDIPGRITILPEPDPVYHPLRFYQKLIATAASMGATHVAMLDADEMLTGNLLSSVRDIVSALPASTAWEVPWIPVRDTLHGRDVTGPRAYYRTGFVFPLSPDIQYPQIATGDYDMHHSRLPLNMRMHSLVHTPEDGGLLHFQYLDAHRLRAKEVLWKMMEMSRWPGRRSAEWLNGWYDAAVYEQGETTNMPDSWWEPYCQWEQYVKIGIESWAEKEVKRLWAEDSSRFTGLNTFGIC